MRNEAEIPILKYALIRFRIICGRKNLLPLRFLIREDKNGDLRGNDFPVLRHDGEKIFEESCATALILKLPRLTSQIRLLPATRTIGVRAKRLFLEGAS